MLDCEVERLEDSTIYAQYDISKREYQYVHKWHNISQMDEISKIGLFPFKSGNKWTIIIKSCNFKSGYKCITRNKLYILQTL